MFKFILAVLGFFVFGRSIGGAIFGFFVGTLIDNYQQVKHFGQQQGGGQRFSTEDIFSYYQQRTASSDFATMLIALSAAVMRADGRVLKAELNYVKAFFAHQFGPQFSARGCHAASGRMPQPAATAGAVWERCEDGVGGRGIAEG